MAVERAAAGSGLTDVAKPAAIDGWIDASLGVHRGTGSDGSATSPFIADSHCNPLQQISAARGCVQGKG